MVAQAAMVGIMAATLTLAGCGRKGPLDPPPGTAVQPPGTQDQSSGGDVASPAAFPGVDNEGRPAATRGPNRRIPLDWLID